MSKRILAALMVVLHLLTLGPAWSAGSTTTSTTVKKKKPATSATTVAKKKPASTVKPASTAAKPTTAAKKPASTKKPAASATAKKSTTATKALTPEQQQVLGHLQMLQEVWQRKITLEYLADKRSDERLGEMLADFPKKLQNNFISNIRGDYKAEFMANYAAKSDEETTNAFALFKDKPALDPVLGSVIKQCPSPLELAYFDLVKKVTTRRKFQAANEPTAEIKKLDTYWQAVYSKMRENASKDRFDAVGALYKDVSAREFPIHWYDDAQHAVAFETEGRKTGTPHKQGRRKWTVLAYVCADNDLERFGLMDVNEMEKVGSDDNINIVAQIDRMRSGDGDTISDGNWVGTRRYYVTKDNDPNKVNSKMVMNIGEASMGTKTTLADFLKWGVKTYPADNVAVIIWNHGAGWIGIAQDQEDDTLLSMTDVSWALREGQKELSAVNGKDSKFAIVDFDACLMGTIEVAYEIADTAQYMTASEETEPGNGMPYADYLAPLAKNPALSPAEFSKRMVGTYVQSYANGGSAGNSYVKGSSVTKSTVDLAKVGELVKKFDRLGSALLANHEVYADLLVAEGGRFASIKRYSDKTLVDLIDFAHKLAQMPEAPSDIREICIDIIKSYGYPVENDRLAKPVLITSDKPGVVVWGYNGGRMPPQSLWPSGTRVFQSRLALTPLRKMEGGGYGTQIGPFEPVKDEALEKIVFVEEINYQVVLEDGKSLDPRRIRQGKEYLIVSKFPETSPMVIEGHTQGMGDSHGLSIYFPPSHSFKNTYKSMRFAKDTSWDEFLEQTPVFKRKAEVLLCGQMVEDPMTLPLIAKALKANKVEFQVLWDPSVFAYQFKDILRQFADKGVVITDSVSASSMGQLAPSSEDLHDYLSRGGRMMMAAQSVGKSNIHRALLKDYFKFTFVEEEKDFDELLCKGKGGEFTLNLNGDESARTASDVTVMKTAEPCKIFVTMPDGRGAAIYASGEGKEGKTYAGVYLGFRFEAVGNTEARDRLMGEILDRLLPERHQMSLF
ncbi:MAG TPA: clostripain-related cysteine peptidase [Candidatus Rifleibacterium sp.]|nr:clostripain-related cysteine peptidase [Candidatus Rifleibacterium sp.]HPT44623.1 clostripain-related cysteine peptidase [Candidatus Rifleibacterium sp.]